MFNVSNVRFMDSVKGNFSMKFDNGYTVSLAMGTGTYSRGDEEGYTSVEVAAWDADGNWVKLGKDDDVIGWQSAADVLALMNKIAAM